QLYLAAIAGHPSCMRRLSISGVRWTPRLTRQHRQKRNEDRDKNRPKMLHRKGLVRSSTTFSTASVKSGKTRFEHLMSALPVRRDKAALSSGCESHPANAPAGSNRSSYGGDEVAEAFG